MMINSKDNFVAWVLLCDELDDAQEHLANLRREMDENPEFSEIEYRTWMAHIFSHLNRAWNKRNQPDETYSDDDWERWSQFPTDIEPG